MPKIRRWFHVSHDLNADPEVWELTDLLGDRALRVWLELLSIADRNNGDLPGWAGERLADPSPQLRQSLAGRCRTTGETVRRACRFFDERLWTVPGVPHRVRNWAEYNKRRETHKNPDGIPSGSPLPILPILPILTEPPLVPHVGDAPPAAYSEGFLAFWSTYPRKVGKDAAWKLWRRLALESSATAICQQVQQQRAGSQWAREGGRYIPNPETYLSQGRWKDEASDPNLPPSPLCAECAQRDAVKRFQHWVAFVSSDELKQHFLATFGVDCGQERFAREWPAIKSKWETLAMQGQR